MQIHYLCIKHRNVGLIFFGMVSNTQSTCIVFGALNESPDLNAVEVTPDVTRQGLKIFMQKTRKV